MTPLSKGVGSPFRRSGGIRAGSTNSPKTLQNNGVAACGIPPSRLFKATHLPLTREALGASNCSTNFCLTTCLQDVFCSDDHDSSSLVLNMRGLHNYIMVNSLFRCRCIACRRCHGRLVIAPTVSNGNALELESATGRMYPAPTHSDDSAQVSACPVVTPYGVDCKCGKQFGKFLFAFLCAGRPCSNDHFSSSFVLNR